ncbi:hypothetical protein F8B43_3876 [Methylorubrum populi]|uniref:Uncharacterized protein n=1 Tax=Methylorubrum populi TaxID=223967 RepID=A0A833J3F4_9HYPH|nr:hypothetical protein F8B43_3876 [Methylorubrum populi]
MAPDAKGVATATRLRSVISDIHLHEVKVHSWIKKLHKRPFDLD